jgi:lipid-A-disaccharide synthase
VDRINRRVAGSFMLAAPAGYVARFGADFYRSGLGGAPVQVVEGESWDVLAHSDLVLAASGTVTVEAALLGAPMVTFYKVTGVSWLLGRFLVDTPFYTMVNLIAGRRVVPELMQNEMNGERIAAESIRLLENPAALAQMKSELAEVAARLSGAEDPLDSAARIVEQLIKRK